MGRVLGPSHGGVWARVRPGGSVCLRLICTASRRTDAQQQGQQRWQATHRHGDDLYHALAVTLFFLTMLLGAAGPATVPIAAGSFLRGSDRAPDEQPVREISLGAFRIDRHEVSVGEYASFLKTGHSERKYWTEQGWRLRQSDVDPQLHRAGRDDSHPVVAVTWYEADAFCRWRGGSLPTEAQWERAACGGAPGPYPWGAQRDVSARWATFVHPTQTMTVATAPVSEDPNPSVSGLRHAAGNVWEWTSDWYLRNAHGTGLPTDPKGPAAGTWKTMRGGSFANLPSFATCTHREPAAPDVRRLTAGFRCAYSMP